MKKTKTIIIFFLLTLLIQSPLMSSQIDPDYIIEKVKMRQLAIENQIQNAVFFAEATYQEKGKNSELKKELIVKKRVYMKPGGKRHEQYLGLSLNGRELYGEELKNELDDWKSKVGRQDSTIMPMTPEGEGKYDYYLIGNEIWNGIKVWVLEFKPKKQVSGYINGKGYISMETYDIVRVDFSPATVPWVISDMVMSLTNTNVEGYWMPLEFDFKMKISINLFVDLFYRTIEIEEKYSDYKFNSPLEDHLFVSQ